MTSRLFTSFGSARHDCVIFRINFEWEQASEPNPSRYKKVFRIMKKKKDECALLSDVSGRLRNRALNPYLHEVHPYITDEALKTESW
jgi:hypothetical protein